MMNVALGTAKVPMPQGPRGPAGRLEENYEDEGDKHLYIRIE